MASQNDAGEFARAKWNQQTAAHLHAMLQRDRQ